MRALSIYRLLSLAVVLLECESSGAGEPKQKSANKDDRKLQYGYGYSYGYGYDYPETGDPTPRPTFKPTPYPTPRPTPVPTHKPSPMPTPYPSPRPTPHPTHKPTMMPTNLPTPAPVPKPTKLPTPNPTPDPTPRPTLHPTPQPTEPPSCEPSPSPSGRPTPLPTPFPTPVPTPRPTPLPTPVPTPLPTPVPTEKPTPFPTRRPTPDPTRRPSEEPTQSEEPSEVPTGSEEPSENPTFSSSFSSSLSGSYTSTCVGETLLDIICADRNQAIFEDFCTALRQTGLDALLDDCRNQLTVFAPNRFAFDRVDGDDDDDDDDCNPSNIGGPAQNCNFVNNIPQPFRQQTCNFLNCQPNTGCCGNGDGDDDDDDDECNPNNNGGPAVNCNFVNNIPQQFRQQTCNFLNCQPNTGCCTNRRLAEDPIREDAMLSTFVAEDNSNEAPRALQSGQCPPNAQSFLNGNTFDYVAYNRAISGCYGPNGFCPPNAQNYFSGTNFDNVGYQQAINECYGGGNGIPGFVPTIPGNVVINPFNPIIPSGNNAVLARLLAYHITNGVYRERDLSCSGRDQSIRMLESGFSETRCNRGAPVIQTGTCNVPGNFPQLIQTNIVAANGIIHVVNNLLIPSPDGTPAGCVGGPFVPTTPTGRPTSAPANSCNTGNVGGPPINCNFLLYLEENLRQCNLYNCQENTGGTCCGEDGCVAARETPIACPPDPACYYDADAETPSFDATTYNEDLLTCNQRGGFVVPPGGFFGPPINCANVDAAACPYLNCLEGSNDDDDCKPRGT